MASNNNSNNKDKPILVTAVGGRVGGVSTHVVEILRKEGVKVRAMMRRDDERAESIRKLGAEVVIGDLTVLEDVHRAINGCSKIFYSMAVGASYLETSLMFIAVAKHYGVELLVNMSQLTVALMKIDKFVPSPQARAHFLVEQALSWSGVPFINIQPTVFIENPLFTHYASESLKTQHELRLPFGNATQTRINPIAAYDVSRVVARVLVNPTPHLGSNIRLAGAKMQTMDEVANEYAMGLGYPVKYVEVDSDTFKKTVIQKYLDVGFGDEHAAKHLVELAKVLQLNNRQVTGNEVEAITGKAPLTIGEWVKEHAQDFKGDKLLPQNQAH